MTQQRPARQSATSLTPRLVLTRYAALLGANRRWLGLIVLLFAASLVAGSIGAAVNPAVHQEYLQRLAERLEPALLALRGGDSLAAIGLIFWNNLRATLLILGMGALIFPLLLGLPLLAVGSNGYLLGALVVLSGMGPLRVLASILPHGVFELPALFVAGAWSLKMGVGWLMPSASGRRLATWSETVAEGLWIVPLVVVLLVIAALVEVLITAPIASMMVG